MKKKVEDFGWRFDGQLFKGFEAMWTVRPKEPYTLSYEPSIYVDDDDSLPIRTIKGVVR